MANFGSSGGLREKIEGSTVVDLMTVFVLVYDFFLLRQAGLTASFNSPSSLLTISGDANVIAAQATGLLLAIYVVEAVIDKSSH
ncbi:MAG: hypothetical protein ABEJ87_05595 [Candidatus Nanohalobium sp.]